MYRFLTGLILYVSLSLIASAEQPPTPRTLVTVNDTQLSELHFELFRRETQQTNAHANPQARVALMNQLVNITILAQTADAEKLSERPEVTAALELARMKILAQAALNQHLQANPVTDAEIDAAFQAKYAKPAYEFKARHILVATEDTAKDLISQLQAGADFGELAKAHSTGPSGKNGGDLGWFEPAQMVAPFSAATGKLEKGAITVEPVKTQFGWHIIRLDDKRARPTPEQEDVKPELTKEIQRERAANYMRAARKKVRVEVQPPPEAGSTTPDAATN